MFYVFWRGQGRWVVFVVGACYLGTIYLVKMLTGGMGRSGSYAESHGWPHALGLLLAGAICVGWGRSINNLPPRLVIDKATGREVMDKPSHSLYGIKIEYWGFVFLALAALILVTKGW